VKVWPLRVIYALRESNNIDSPLTVMNHERSAYYSLQCGLNASGLNTRFCCLVYVGVKLLHFASMYRFFLRTLKRLLHCPPSTAQNLVRVTTSQNRFWRHTHVDYHIWFRRCR